MFASRTAAARNVQRISRSFATVVDAGGLKVAAVDYNQPTSSITLLAKAGSRYETKPGVANVLKNFAFKSTTSRSALGTVRESELYGGVLSASLSREYLALTAEFLRGDEQLFADILSSFVTSARFTRHELEEYVMPIVESDTLAAASNPATHAVDLAHALAFRSGLGSSLFAPAHNHYTVEDVKALASAAFSKSNIAVLGTGIDQTTLANIVDKSLSKLSASSSSATSPSTYFGGETRVASHGGPQTVFIGFGTSGPSAELAALAAHLSPEPAVKWSEGVSPLSHLADGASVQSVYLPYSDAALFGLLVQAPTPAAVKTAATKAVSTLKSAAAGLKADELKRATAKAKFGAASAVDSREGIVSVLGSKVLAGSPATLEATLSSLSSLNGSAFTKATSALIKSKPTFVAVGDIASLPYADELGL